MKRIVIWVLALCAVAAAAWGVYYYYQSRSDQTPAPAAKGGKGGKGGRGGANVPVVAAPATTADVGVLLDGLGSVMPVATVTVRSRVDGQLMKLLFKEGQVVRKGELLAEIDPRPAQVQLATAEGQLAKDQSLLKNAQVDLERYRVLFKQDSIAKQQLDTQDALVRQYEATLKVDRAAIDNAKLQLDYTRITAPVGGRLGLRQVDLGNIVRAGDANGLVVITQLQPITVVFTVAEDKLPPVLAKLKSDARLTVEAYDREQKQRLATGDLQSIDNQIDPTTGTVKFKAVFANADGALFPNQFVNARLLVDMLRNVTLVPNAAIQRSPQSAYVYIVKPDNTVAARNVAIQMSQGDDTAIASGLTPGETVVVDGVDKLQPGSKVAARTPSAAPPRS